MIKKLYETLKIEASSSNYQHIAYAIFSIIGFGAFFFINNELIEHVHESPALRLIAIGLSFVLLFAKFIFKKNKGLLSFYWYVVLTYNLSFFFFYMIITNEWSVDWQMNLLTSLVLLAVLSGWLSLLILGGIGMLLATTLAYYQGFAINYPVNVTHFLISLISVLAFTCLFSEKSRNAMLKKIIEVKEQANQLLEQKVYERTLYLEEALQAKRNLLANVSHEVRTPLHGILNLAQMMFEGWGEPNKENIRTLYDVSRRLEELVSNILDLSAIEADQMKLSPSEFDVLEMSHETISQARGIAAGLNKTIKYSFKSDKEFASKIYADRRKLKQVLYNILSNAIKYCGDENEITVSVFDMENPQFFAISIEDRGIGIPEGEEEHIFEAFAESSRTKSMAGGKGLGLALTREIMRMHGGKVWAKNNELKKGATFYVVLSKDGSTIHPDYIAGNDESEGGEKPAKPQEEKRKIIVPSSKNISRKTAQVEVVDSKKIGPKKGRIMIIDDEEIVRNTAAIILQSMGYDTVSAASGPAAFEYLEQNSGVTIDLILLDLMMPEMYGITVLEKLKASASLVSIPVVIQSGSSDHNELNRALKTGAVSILAKPYSKTEIEQTIAEVLG